MKQGTLKQSAAIVIAAFVIQLFIVPLSADAAWRSEYDDYPGNDSPPWGTIVLVGVIGGVAIAVLAMAISHSSKDKKADGESDQADDSMEGISPGQDEPADVDENSSEKITMSTFRPESSKLNLYFDLGQTPHSSGLDISSSDVSGMEVKVGVALSF